MHFVYAFLTRFSRLVTKWAHYNFIRVWVIIRNYNVFCFSFFLLQVFLSQPSTQSHDRHCWFVISHSSISCSSSLILLSRSSSSPTSFPYHRDERPPHTISVTNTNTVTKQGLRSSRLSRPTWSATHLSRKHEVGWFLCIQDGCRIAKKRPRRCLHCLALCVSFFFPLFFKKKITNRIF